MGGVMRSKCRAWCWHLPGAGSCKAEEDCDGLSTLQSGGGGTSVRMQLCAAGCGAEAAMASRPCSASQFKLKVLVLI